jgi:4-amino-4-deoxy-L-arabinose transferase-like glycosyltransferase
LNKDRDSHPPVAAQTETAPRGSYKFAIVFVVAYAAAVFLPFLGWRTLTSHEITAVHPAQRLLEDGHWIVPHYASGWWLDKPPLMNWLVAASFVLLGGFSEFAARLPAAVCGIVLCLLMALLAGRFYSPRVALLTGLVQATCVYMYTEGRLAEVDILFALLLTGAHGVLFWRWGGSSVPKRESPIGGAILGTAPTSVEHADCRNLENEFALPWTTGLLFYTLAALAVLTKGPVAAVFLAATVFFFGAIRRSWKPVWAVARSPGLVLFVMIAGGWHVAAYLAVGREALYQWNYNGIQRLLGLHHVESDPFYSYFYNIPMLLLPWTPALLLGAGRLRAEARGPQAGVHQFLWAWIIGGFLFLLLSLFKHKHYAIPILPPFSVFAGLVLDAHISAAGNFARRFYHVVFVTALVVLGIVGGYVIPRRDYRRPTAEFVRHATAQVPEREILYVVGLAQTPAYPYILHRPLRYIDDLGVIEKELRDRGGRPMWVLTIDRVADMAVEHGLRFVEELSETPRARQPPDKTVVLGLLSAMPR